MAAAERSEYSRASRERRSRWRPTKGRHDDPRAQQPTGAADSAQPEGCAVGRSAQWRKHGESILPQKVQADGEETDSVEADPNPVRKTPKSEDAYDRDRNETAAGIKVGLTPSPPVLLRRAERPG